MENHGKSPFFMGKSPLFMGKSPFFMGKSLFPLDSSKSGLIKGGQGTGIGDTPGPVPWRI